MSDIDGIRSDLREILERIHHIQARLDELTGRLRRGPVTLKLQETNIEKLEAKLAQLNEALHKLQAEAKRKELEVDASTQAIEKRKTQLRESKSNKEYQALQLQIAADEAARSVLEDEAIEAIEKAEKFAENLPGAKAEVDKARELFETTKKKYFEEKPTIEAEIKELRTRLEEIEAHLPRDFREIYDRLVKSVGGAETLASVVNQKFCGGCNYQIPINSLAQILQKKPIVCSSCARLLFVTADFVFDKGG